MLELLVLAGVVTAPLFFALKCFSNYELNIIEYGGRCKYKSIKKGSNWMIDPLKYKFLEKVEGRIAVKGKYIKSQEYNNDFLYTEIDNDVSILYKGKIKVRQEMKDVCKDNLYIHTKNLYYYLYDDKVSLYKLKIMDGVDINKRDMDNILDLYSENRDMDLQVSMQHLMNKVIILCKTNNFSTYYFHNNVEDKVEKMYYLYMMGKTDLKQEELELIL